MEESDCEIIQFNEGEIKWRKGKNGVWKSQKIKPQCEITYINQETVFIGRVMKNGKGIIYKKDLKELVFKSD